MDEVRDDILHIGLHAENDPERAAIIWADSGEVMTFAQLNESSRRLAIYFRAQGLQRGDHIAVLMENLPDYFVVCWAALRSGLYFTPVNWHLTPDEISYVVEDCGAKALITSCMQMKTAQAIVGTNPRITVRLVAGLAQGTFASLQAILDAEPSTTELDECEGQSMFYSSGTTGRPKGIKRPLPDLPWGLVTPSLQFMCQRYGMSASTIYLCPAPLYHAAPLLWCILAQRVGGTVVLMERFDELLTLQYIESYKVTLAQFVPTMFVRMLNLPEADRRRFDLSSLEMAVHAAAPCPIEVKRKMIDWFGPIIHEYYSASEGNGVCWVDSKEWLAHPGTVGQSIYGEIHILDDDGNELPVGEVGKICFGGNEPFAYHNDPEKTASVYSAQGWSTVGDIGHLDANGYLYLSDRRTDLIISGGVNIYPRETEETLLLHPCVLDVAVVGIPNDDFGEEVLAVVELKLSEQASKDLASELIEFCRARIAHLKCPKRVEFDRLPRTETGKMLRRMVKEQYRNSMPSN